LSLTATESQRSQPPHEMKSILYVCSSLAGDGPATGDGGVFRPGNSVPIPSGGSRCVVWSQRCDTLSTRTDSAAAEDTPRCHSVQRQQRAESASAGVHWHCSSDIGLDIISATGRLELGHQHLC